MGRLSDVSAAHERSEPPDLGEVSIVDQPDQNRYELRVDGKVRGLVVYCDRGDVRALVHTEIDQPLQGMGLAADLVRRVLDDIVRDGRQVVPSCPYVDWYIQRHAEYQPLLAAGAHRA